MTTARWALLDVAASTRPLGSSRRSSGTVVRKSTANRSSVPGRHADSSTSIVPITGATIARPVDLWKAASDHEHTTTLLVARIGQVDVAG